jgi:ubiquitin carboxyl-terminal hydrolase 12/46
LRCHTVTERHEKFYDLLLQVINCEDLAKSFRSYLAPELLDGCNSYACDICGTKQSAHRRVAIHSVPSLLTISCQRFDIDRKTWQRVKVTSKNEFPLALVFLEPSSFVPAVLLKLIPLLFLSSLVV